MSVFKDLNAQHWQSLVNITGWEHVPSGLDVTRQGQYGTKLYVVIGRSGAGAINRRQRYEIGPSITFKRGANGYYGINGHAPG